MIEDLDSSSFFQDLTVAQLHDISAFCTPLSLGDGDMLIQEAERGQPDLYVLCAGSVEIVSNAAPIISDEVVISKMDKDIFGEIGWLTGSKRTASVRCHGEVRAIQVDGEALTGYLNSHPDVGYMVLRRVSLTLAERMKNTDSLLKQILWNSVL
jgi:CRP-like cAMP-binding protein